MHWRLNQKRWKSISAWWSSKVKHLKQHTAQSFRISSRNLSRQKKNYGNLYVNASRSVFACLNFNTKWKFDFVRWNKNVLRSNSRRRRIKMNRSEMMAKLECPQSEQLNQRSDRVVVFRWLKNHSDSQASCWFENLLFLWQDDEDCRPLSPLSPVKIDEPLSLSLYSDNHIASWNFPAWAKTKGISSANGAVDQVNRKMIFCFDSLISPFKIHSNSFFRTWWHPIAILVGRRSIRIGRQIQWIPFVWRHACEQAIQCSNHTENLQFKGETCATSAQLWQFDSRRTKRLNTIGWGTGLLTDKLCNR